ncbi:MAG: PEP/pyruvate-binding domain-containing protein, partial [Geminicoccaceae bacterium]
MSKWVYSFGAGQAEGTAAMGGLLGGKGANLAEMAQLGLAVPPGFTLTTEICSHYYQQDRRYPADLKAEVEAALLRVESEVGSAFGDPEQPLLLSVRSGAPVSMPGMMDTVLNLGLNDRTIEGLARRSGDARFAYDSYRRFIQMYGDVVLGLDHFLFEDQLEDLKLAHGYTLDTELGAEDLARLIETYQVIIEDQLGKGFPQDVHEQLWGAIGAVFGSWMTPRAVTYRRLHDIAEDMGTAVNVQAMVFGNLDDASATGVAFTRDPSTGEKRYYGEFLINAQGEDVVAGIRTPQPLTTAMKVET